VREAGRAVGLESGSIGRGLGQRSSRSSSLTLRGGRGNRTLDLGHLWARRTGIRIVGALLSLAFTLEPLHLDGIGVGLRVGVFQGRGVVGTALPRVGFVAGGQRFLVSGGEEVKGMALERVGIDAGRQRGLVDDDTTGRWKFRERRQILLSVFNRSRVDVDFIAAVDRSGVAFEIGITLYVVVAGDDRRILLERFTSRS
jgi:hypothetical protein